jgi:uncharacterized protein
MICRTHGLPMAIEYRGKRSIGFCQKNFRKLDPVPDDAVFDLGWLNNNLTAINQMFINEFSDRMGLSPRLSIGEALLLDF